jgi:HSP20 family protein
MAKQKKSFFEKLTGIVKIKDDDSCDMESIEQIEEEIKESGDETEGQLAIDMYQTQSDIIIKTMVAGVKPEELDISITRDLVIIKGRREEARMDTCDDYFHRELYWGSFSRTIILPQEIDSEEAEATNKNGLLIIKLPILDKNRQTKLKIKSV